MIWWIFTILIFALWLYFKFNRSIKHKDIIGKKVLVSYWDQNTDFEAIFPMTGILTEKIKVGTQDFFIVQFDKSFVYHNRDYEKIAIKERHIGNYIGSDGEVHVHVFLPKKELMQDQYELADFDHVVWATVKNRK